MISSQFEPSSPEMLAEIVRQAEARLSAQLTAGVAADQRAMTFASLLLAATAVLFGTALAATLSSPRMILIVAVGIGLIIAAGMAIWTAQPSDWDYVGNMPSEWLGDIAANKSLHTAMAETASWYNDMIGGNESVIASSALVMRRAIVVAILSIAFGVLIGLTLAICRV